MVEKMWNIQQILGLFFLFNFVITEQKNYIIFNLKNSKYKKTILQMIFYLFKFINIMFLDKFLYSSWDYKMFSSLNLQ